VKVPDVLPLKLPSPLYTVVMEGEPTESEDVVNVADPEVLSATVASTFEPSWNVTFPLGLPEPGETTET
jgi:hypothetical protein